MGVSHIAMERKKTYTELLKDPRWQKKRLEIYERDNFTCNQCKNTKKTVKTPINKQRIAATSNGSHLDKNSEIIFSNTLIPFRNRKPFD